MAAGQPTVRVVPGPNATPPVVLVHGFTQTGACLGPLADDLASDRAVVHPDLPGHGRSTAPPDADLWAVADELADRLAATTDGPATWIGYSLGGRACLHVALAHPGIVDRLVLIGATAGIDEAGERAARQDADERLAGHLEEIGVAAFLDEWLAGPLFATLPGWARFDDERRTNTEAGLAASLRHAGTGAMAPLWDRLGTIEAPTLVLAGERDAKFRALGERLVAAIGANATFQVVPGAGHAAHLEAPAATIAAIRSFCGASDPQNRAARSTERGGGQPPT
jgi:2-succinyl-6-hydroxy-2,4-cyclohexadiene-1-carboxylate synthase